MHEGQHPPIVTLDLWDEVQKSLRDHTGAARTRRTRQSSDALLAGKLYDDSGNRMSPTWARKGSKRWRYYVSQAALQGDKSKAILRVPAADVETLVTEALGKLSPDRAASQTDIRSLIDRAVIGGATIRIQLSEVAEGTDSARILTLPWTRPSPHRKREIIQGANDAKSYARPMPANARAILIEALRDAHRWLDELLSDPRLTLESVASREDKSERSIRMTLSLAFLVTIPGVGQLTALALWLRSTILRASADPEMSAPIWAWSPGGISRARWTTSTAYRNAGTERGANAPVRGRQCHADSL